MQINTSKAIALGSIAGAAALILLELILGFLIRLATASPPLFRPVSPFWLMKEALLGAFLGAITFSSLVLAWSGNNRKAGRLCVVGGVIMVSLMLFQIGFVIYQALHLAPGMSVRVPGPSNVPMHIRGIIVLIMFNIPLQWSLVLITSAVWMLRKKRVTS